MRLASFDIFDTTLVRKCGAPQNIFYLTALSLFGDDRSKRDYFVFWRKQAEGISSLMLNEKHLSLEQIYHSYEQEYFGIDRKTAIEKEKQIESDNLCVNPILKTIIDESRQRGREVCFISDMYLDKDFLYSILNREGCCQAGDRIYISAEHKKSKAKKGELFEVVRSELKPRSWVHYGDNKHSDIKQAKRHGIEAKFVDTGFNQAEKSALNHFRQSCNNREISLIIGWMRWARLSNGGNSTAEIAADFVAPLYISYVQFTLRRAKAKGIRRLYFLNRDSYTLYKIAEHIEGVDIRYLYISRKSLVLPAIEQLTDEAFLEVFDQMTLLRKDVDGILAFIKSSRQELESYGIKFSFNKIASSQQQREVLDKILRSDFTPILKERIAKEKTLLCDYLKQEGVNDDLESAFVDVGWLGTTRLMINKILRSEGYRDVDFFYLGVRKDILPMKYGSFHSFIKEPVRGLTSLIENYFSVSPYPTVTSYFREEDKVSPRLKDEPISQTMQKILDSNLRCSIELAQQIKTFDLRLPLTEVSLFMLAQLSDFKLKINVKAFTQVDFYDAPSSNSKMAFVKKMNPIELFRYCILGEGISAVDNISIKLTLGGWLGSKMIALNAYIGLIKKAILKKITR